MPRRKTGSLLLRTQVTTSGVNYQSDDIDISALVDVPKGDVLLVKRAWLAFSADGSNNAPAATSWPVPGGAANTSDSQITAMATALTHAGTQPMSNADAIAKAYCYGAVDASSNWTFFEIINLMRPQEFDNGMYVATDQIHCSVDVGVALQAELDVSFVFECETVKLSREQALDLAVSLQQ
ncbi:MAG TPA: hypothetical protein EYN67_13910 [Flavobacteriales bacterium]|nr:hypothetical protein [Flavobacteriales bacterium]